MKYKKHKKIELTEGQLRRLRRLWFIYGNNGPHHTGPNHAVLQGFIEHGEDYRNSMAGNPKHGRPTQECLMAIQNALIINP